MKKYFWNILISIDQFANTVLGGDPDETISSRLGKDRDKNIVTKTVSWFLDLFEEDHVEVSVESDEGKDNAF